MSIFSGFPLRRKILILLLIVALIPFSLTNVYWYINARDTVNKTAEQNLITTTLQATDNVNNYLNTKLLGFLSHSQGAALLSGSTPLIQNDLSNFLLQDPDIISLTFTDKTGQEIVKIDRNKVYEKNDLADIKNTPEFKVPAFKFGKEYISPVIFTNTRGVFKVSTPVVYPENSESLLTFSSSKGSPRSPGEVFGVLIGEVSISRLQNSMEAVRIGKEGYISIIDTTGTIIVHKLSNLVGTNVRKQLSSDITAALNPLIITESITPIPKKEKSIDNISVLSTFLTVPRTKWVVVAQEPQSEISQDIVRIQQQALLLFILPFLAVIFLSYIFSNSLTNPIKQLVQAAIQIGKGNFDVNFSVKTSDEMQQLADSYHAMANQLKSDRNSLIAERNTLSTVLDTTADGVIGLTDQFIILFTNNAANQLMGNGQELINKSFDSRVTLIENKTTVTIEKLCLNPESAGQKLKLFTNNNQEKTIHLIIAKVPEHIVTPIKYILTMYDISKEEELEDMKVDFVSLAAHELRTPLTSIKGYLSMYIDQNKQTFRPEQRELIDRISDSAKRLGLLVESILKVTRIEKTGVTLNYQKTDWAIFLQRVIEDVKTSADEKKISLQYTVAPGNTPQIFIDQERINEVVTNLLTNAIKYTDQGGTIKIIFIHKDDEIVTFIKDTGQGIPKESLPHLFTKFYRVPGKLEQTIQGTGLGLYITKQILALHQGKIWVESEVGKGSTFAFSLPLVPQANYK